MKAEKKKHRRFPLRMFLLLLILIAAGSLILMFKSFDFNISEIFYKTEKTASSTAILKQIKDISRLNSVEFIYKTVFPWDLIDRDVDLSKTIKKYRAGEKINFKEAEALAVYGIAGEAGIDLLSDTYKFAVISTQVKAGWELSESSEDMIFIDKESNTIKIKMPRAEVTEIIIDDSDSSTYDYPDLDVSPEQWRTLTAILSRKVKTEAEQRQIIELAEKRGQEFIRRMLKNSGFSEVIFIE